MTLVATDGVFGIVAKVANSSESAAQTLLRLGLYETLADDIDAMRPQLDLMALDAMEHRNAEARSALLRMHVGKALYGQPTDDLELAGYLGMLDEYVEVEKGILQALAGAALTLFNRQHPRGEGGRFVRQDASIGQAHRMTNDWKETGLAEDKSKMHLHYAQMDPSTGKPLVGTSEEKEETTVGGFNDKHQEYIANNPRSELVGISLDRAGIPNENPKQRAAFDAMMTFAGPANATQAMPIIRGLTRDDTKEKLGAAATDWNRPTEGSDRQSYRRMQLTGQALASVSMPGSTANTLGQMAQLIGNLGPEAENVLSPGIRRIAYRYRGTERRPDQDTVQEIKTADVWAAKMTELKGADRDNAMGELDRISGSRATMPPSTGVAAYYASDPSTRGWNSDRLELAMRGDVAAAKLVDAVPSEELTQISYEAGELPPSTGLLIDADGDVVAHAQGFNGDHYLPFDLRSLGGLQGGQYVRTRAAGGLTSEDIYTGLLTGARQVQVISNSGVFTLEMDPDLRGGRRYSDKARRMVQRYDALVAAIKGGNLYSNDLPPEQLRELKERAYQEAGYDETAGEKRFQVLRNQARLKSSVQREMSDEEINQKATDEIDAEDPGYSPQQRAQHINDLAGQMRRTQKEGQVRQYTLDGTGYAAAMQTLQQEFPFYIRDARYETVPEFIASRGIKTNRKFEAKGRSRDTGHVERGQVMPTKLAIQTGRLVPTGRAEPAPRATETPTQRPGGAQTETPAGGAQQPAAGGVSTPVPAGTVTHRGTMAPIVENTHKLADHLAEGTAVRRHLQSLIGGFGQMMNQYSNSMPQTQPTADVNIVENDRPAEYAYALWNMQQLGMSGDAKKIADYLLKATPQSREKYLKGLELIDRAISNSNDPAVSDDADLHLGQSMTEAHEELSGLFELSDPFVQTPMPPTDKLDKPPKISAIEALGDKPENYNAFRLSAEQSDPELFQAMDDLERQGKASNQRNLANYVNRAYEDAMQQESNGAPPDDVAELTRKANLQAEAWAFLTGERLAKHVSGLPFGKALGRPSQGELSPALQGLLERLSVLSPSNR